MTDNSILQANEPAAPDDGVAPRATVTDGATPSDGRAQHEQGHLAGITLRQIVRLAMYPREAIYLVDLADGRQRQVAPAVWPDLVQAAESHPDSHLSPVPAGRHDVIWRVEWTTREEV